MEKKHTKKAVFYEVEKTSKTAFLMCGSAVRTGLDLSTILENVHPTYEKQFNL